MSGRVSWSSSSCSTAGPGWQSSPMLGVSWPSRAMRAPRCCRWGGRGSQHPALPPKGAEGTAGHGGLFAGRGTFRSGGDPSPRRNAGPRAAPAPLRAVRAGPTSARCPIADPAPPRSHRAVEEPPRHNARPELRLPGPPSAPHLQPESGRGVPEGRRRPGALSPKTKAPGAALPPPIPPRKEPADLPLPRAAFHPSFSPATIPGRGSHPVPPASLLSSHPPPAPYDPPYLPGAVPSRPVGSEL